MTNLNSLTLDLTLNSKLYEISGLSTLKKLQNLQNLSLKFGGNPNLNLTSLEALQNLPVTLKRLSLEMLIFYKFT